MSEIISAHADCKFENEFVLFDTNVWLAIYGNDPRPEKQVYSDFYASVLEAGNTVIVNEQVISEFFNRFCKMEFESLFGRARWRDYKRLRKTDNNFKSRVSTVKDICLEILSDCTYQQSNLQQDCLETNLSLVVDGELDLTDAALVSECASGKFVLVSHDGDFAKTSIRFVTGNMKVLKMKTAAS
ncbi:MULTISPECIES: PIN domain-containing protein [unclassified Sulfitobacter]|uniref:PIN domain-containing protein n=1 Tax=unclassified Sulfitobacter TaxID=196795 RepID=UPI001F2EA6D4|nr:PIN domain-containing protein [Sulfitobacter sp. M39]